MAFQTWMSVTSCLAPWSSTIYWRSDMPQMHIIPVNQGITPDEIGTRLAAGWTYLGQMNVRRDSGIIDPTQPLTAEGLVPAYVWIQLEPVVPSSVLATVLWQMDLSGEYDTPTLDDLAQKLLGVPLAVVESQMTTYAAEMHAGEEPEES
jgi:hypothetical protein